MLYHWNKVGNPQTFLSEVTFYLTAVNVLKESIKLKIFALLTSLINATEISSSAVFKLSFKFLVNLFCSNSKSLPSDFWLWSLVCAPGPPHLYPSNMVAVCMLVPAPTLPKARRSCAVASFSFSEAARKVSILDRARCHNHWLNLRCLSKQMMLGWYDCSCVEDLESEWGDGRATTLLTKEDIG